MLNNVAILVRMIEKSNGIKVLIPNNIIFYVDACGEKPATTVSISYSAQLPAIVSDRK